MSPRRPSSSFGLIAVSTMAMVFAVSSSLLLFSAHRYRLRDGRTPAAQMERVRPRAQMVPPAPSVQEACKAPVYRSNADGRTEIVFEDCQRYFRSR